MARPTRTFTGQEGQRATGSAGPDPIRRDFDAIFAMFNPEATLPTGEAGGIDASENMKAVQLDPNHEPDADAGKIPTILSGIVNRLKAITGMPDWKNTPPTTLAGVHNQVNNITVNQNQSPQSDTGNLQQMLSWIVNRLRAITGREDWKDDPGVTLQDISDKASHDDISFHAIAKSGVHGVGNAFVAKTSRSDQWPSWNDIPDKPTSFPVGPHQHSAQDIISGQIPPERIGNLPASKVTSGQFDPARIPNLPASKVTSGTFSQDRLPKASTSQQGIVQLTNSRSSTSETLAVTAKALNDHRTSADHDGRYYTKQEVDQRIQNLSQVGLQVYREVTIVSRSSSLLIPFQEAIFDTHNVFESETSEIPVPVPGIYLVHFRCFFDLPAPGSWYVHIRRNGVRVNRGQGYSDLVPNLSVVLSLNPTDYIDVEVQNFTSDASQTVRDAFLSLVRL